MTSKTANSTNTKMVPANIRNQERYDSLTGVEKEKYFLETFGDVEIAPIDKETMSSIESFEIWAKETAQHYEDQTKDGTLGLCRAYAFIRKMNDDYYHRFTPLDWTPKHKIANGDNGVANALWKELDILVGSKTRQTINRMIAVGKDHRLFMNRDLMPAGWGTLYELTRLDDEQLKVAIEDGRINPSMTRADAQKIRYPNGTNKTKRHNEKESMDPNLRKSIEDGEIVKVAVIYAKPSKMDSVLEQINEWNKGRDGFYINDTYTPKKEFDEKYNALEKLIGDSLSSVSRKRIKVSKDKTTDDYRENEVLEQIGREYLYDKDGYTKENGMKRFVRREDFLDVMKQVTTDERAKEFFSDFTNAEELQQFYVENPGVGINDARELRGLQKPTTPSIEKKGSVSRKMKKIDNTGSEKKVA